jgi:predicted lipid-binding transport protein (Tim44 family)
MLRIGGLIAALVFGVLMLAPDVAEARAGGGKSQGSRGYNTYQQTPAKPIDRSVTQRQSPAPAALPGQSAGGGFLQRSPFMTGLLGGLLGAGLFGMLFHNPAWAAEGSNAGSMAGLLLQFALIGLAAWAGLSLFRRSWGHAPAAAGAAAGSLPAAAPLSAGTGSAIEPGPAITADDQREFGDLLVAIQRAWSEGDLAKLRPLATPEMVSYFAEDLAGLASRGERNVVRDLALVKGDVVDHWVEGDRQYATAVMTWRAVDYLERGGAAVDGDDTAPSEATEAWTFLRAAGGKWLLSAIQQV